MKRLMPLKIAHPTHQNKKSVNVLNKEWKILNNFKIPKERFVLNFEFSVLINMMVNTTDYTDCADYDRVLIVGETTKNHIK